MGQAALQRGQPLTKPHLEQKYVSGAIAAPHSGHMSTSFILGGSPRRCPLPPHPGHMDDPEGPAMKPRPRHAMHLAFPRHLGHLPVPPQNGHGPKGEPRPEPPQAAQRPSTQWEDELAYHAAPLGP